MRNEFKVEAILDKKHNEKEFGQEEYLIKWKGYPRSESTWEPLTNLAGCLQMVVEFNAKRWRTKKRHKIDAEKMEKPTQQHRVQNWGEDEIQDEIPNQLNPRKKRRTN
jgi:hypothetical protein